tara:strand:+ start:112 stop:366 length:255 start_codon:yes stop_codon:yes gene_type:complete
MDLSKLNSDRLWALLLFIAVVAGNASLDLGIEQEQLELVAYGVIAFILGKSVRGTGMQNVVDMVVGALSQGAEAIPKVDSDAPE